MMSAAGFCDQHQRWLNEFGWCDAVNRKTITQAVRGEHWSHV